MKGIVQKTGDFVKKNDSKLLLAGGIILGGTAIVSAIWGTSKAEKLLNEQYYAKDIVPDRKQIVKDCWKYYIPTAVLSAGAIACFICSRNIEAGKKVALLGAYSVLENRLKATEDKLVEGLDSAAAKLKKEEILKKVNKETAEKVNVEASAKDIIQAGGSELCMDSLSGRLFMSSPALINAAVDRINRKLPQEVFVTLNEFYYELDIPDIVLGRDIGWDIQYGYLDVLYTTQLTEDGHAVLVVNYTVRPMAMYN